MVANAQSPGDYLSSIVAALKFLSIRPLKVDNGLLACQMRFFAFRFVSNRIDHGALSVAPNMI